MYSSSRESFFVSEVIVLFIDIMYFLCCVVMSAALSNKLLFVIGGRSRVRVCFNCIEILSVLAFVP